MNQSKLLDWRGQTAVVLASGPSLTQEQISRAAQSDANIVAVNSTADSVILPEVIYAGDFLWWKVNHAKNKHRNAHLWTQDRTAAERYQLNWVKGVNRDGLGRDYIHNNGNSGMQAINLAFLFGARRILLLGFDMKLGPNGERHHHPDHPAPLIQNQTFEEWVHKGKKFADGLKAAGCEVINCTPGSAWKDFPMSTIEKELP